LSGIEHGTPSVNCSVSWQWRRVRWERRAREMIRGVRHPGHGFSFVRLLIVLNLVLFAAMVLQGAVAGMGARPLLNPDTYLLIHSGAQYWPLVLAEGEWWRCLTYAFTHGGLIHLAFNMVVLYQVGPLIEFEIGRARFLFLYLLTALTGTAAGYFWHPLTPVVGASGALFGLIGFAAAFHHRMGDPVAIERRNFMLQWAIFAFIFGLLVGADNAGHLGGALGGTVLGFLLPIRGPLLRRTDWLFNLLAALGAAATAWSLGMLVFSWFTR
jgi:rhomboid protease GluP